MKVIHLPTSVGGNSWGLAQGENQIGLNSQVLITQQNWLNYPTDIDLELNKKTFIKGINIRYRLFKEIRNQYDVFHFNYGSSLLDFQKAGLFLLDLPFYPEGKKRIFTYNGSDARQVHPLEYWTDLPQAKNSFYREIIFKMKKLKIIKATKYANHIFALNPDLLHFLPKHTTFLPYSISRWNDIEVKSFKTNRDITIVHSPTSRDMKGSIYIIEALKKLQMKYHNINVKIIENVPHDQALKMYMEADIIIDQVLIGWYGAFGVEVMKMGIPLAVYIREEDLKFIPKDMASELKKSIINISPYNIENILAEYIENPKKLEEKSKAGKEYVNRWHTPQYVASLTKEVYEK